VAQYRSILGRDLARVLCADSWQPIKARTDKVVLWKGDQQPKSLVLNLPISVKRVRAICKSAGISAERFEELFASAPQAGSQWLVK
jgi:hypothetical protein